MTTRSRKKPKRTAFVPRMVLGTTFVALVPVCVTGCGTPAGVADVAFRPEVTVADVSFRPDAVRDSVAADAFSVADVGFDGRDGFSVADVGFDGRDGFSVADTGFRPDGGNG